MFDRAAISKQLVDLGFDPSVLNRYHESHRFYHTQNHISDLLIKLSTGVSSLSNELFLTAVYHDAIYNPVSATNEEDSANLFLEEAASSVLSEASKKQVYQMILDTKTHTASSELSQRFIDADLDVFNGSLEELIRYEHQIFKEFQFVDFKTYQQKRIEVLERFNTNGRLNALIAYVKQRKPLIGVFAGSFNPFHRGHYNVLQKAERIFDKVIIAFGKNPEKSERTWPVPQQIKNRQLMEYTGLLTDFVESLGYDVIVVRGLRNSTDFQYEQNQYRYIQELKPDIKIINVFCDKEFEHISSSGIRTLEKFDKHHQYLLE
jgi:pantetheine-phosphate adenylyltransferase